jgi:acetyl-CoA acyltransferase 1
MSHARKAVLAKGDNDVVIVYAIRSAMTKVNPDLMSPDIDWCLVFAQGKKGGFKDTRPEEILSAVLREVYTRPGLNPALIEDIAVGNVLPPSGGASAARMAALHAGIPDSVALNTVNRQCSSGLSAVNQIANEILTGQIDIGIGQWFYIVFPSLALVHQRLWIGAGVESMTFGFGAAAQPDGWSEAVCSTQAAEDCLIPMGITSENVAKQFGISRAKQDVFAAQSFQKAAAAQKAGKFKAEIVPVKVKWTDPKTEQTKTIVVEVDDGIRDGVTAESLAKLKPAFTKDGTTHAGMPLLFRHLCPQYKADVGA